MTYIVNIFKFIIDNFNSVGLLLTMVGVYIIYKNSPVNEYNINGGVASTDFGEIKRDVSRRNSNIRIGLCMVIIGTLLQLVSNFIPY